MTQEERIKKLEGDVEWLMKIVDDLQKFVIQKFEKEELAELDQEEVKS